EQLPRERDRLAGKHRIRGETAEEMIDAINGTGSSRDLAILRDASDDLIQNDDRLHAREWRNVDNLKQVHETGKQSPARIEFRGGRFAHHLQFAALHERREKRGNT